MTKNEQRAPGPWIANRVNPNCDILIESGGPYNIIATVWKSHPSFEATAHLIAAAPELMAALRIIEIELRSAANAKNLDEKDFERDYPQSYAAWKQARAAILKATGQEG